MFNMGFDALDIKDFRIPQRIGLLSAQIGLL